MKEFIYNDENIAKYFAGELDEKTMETMEKELLNSREKENEIKDFSRLWEKSTELADYDKIDADADWQKTRKKMGFDEKTKKISLSKYFIRIAAILVVSVGLTYLVNEVLQHYSKRTNNDYLQISSADAMQEFLLPDNTKIILNKNASLIYNSNYGKNNRDVILEGEGFFNVEKNKEIPFRVFVGNSTVEVLGTSFNIKSETEVVTVSVVSGHVAFYETESKDNRIELLKNEQSKFNLKHKNFESISPLNINNMAWRTHQLIFNYEPVKNVFEKVAEYYNKELVVSKDVDLNWKFKGEFDNNSIDEVINFINLTYPNKCDVVITDRKLIISQKSLN